jgi:L-alanine-DL-glutamate epimerase-like enolase superfamily enzyme
VLRTCIGHQPGTPRAVGGEADAGEMHRLLAPRINAVLGGALTADTAELATKVTALATQGYAVVKVKLGLAPPDTELGALRRLAADLPAGVALRLDANRAWDEATAARLLDAFAELPVEAVEEPLAHPDLAALRRLQQELPYPLALDESLPGIDLQAFFGDAASPPPVRRLVLKLAPLGGLLPAWALAQRAATAGIECAVTTGVDSACATLAAAHLAAALATPLAHGLATSSWLANDTGPAPTIMNGTLSLPVAAGLGFVPAGAGSRFIPAAAR